MSPLLLDTSTFYKHYYIKKIEQVLDICFHHCDT